MEKNIVSEERLLELKSRSKRCVCKYCGGKLKVRLLDFGQIETHNMEIFCENCDRIEYGTEPEIYRSAVYLVDNLGFNAFPDRVDNIAARKLNIAKVCEVIAWHENQMGFLDEKGYRITLGEGAQSWDYADGSIIVNGENLT